MKRADDRPNFSQIFANIQEIIKKHNAGNVVDNNNTSSMVTLLFIQKFIKNLRTEKVKIYIRILISNQTVTLYFMR